MANWIRGLVCALVLAAAPAFAETRPLVKKLAGGPPASLLYIGNSFFYYNNGINNFMQGFVKAADANAKLRAVMVTISGSGVDWHDVKSYFRPNALSRYSFDEKNNVVFNRFDRLFDATLIMDCSQCPIHPELKKVFQREMARHLRTIRANKSEPVLYMSWAYQDKPEMTQQLAEAYTSFANAHRALVVPAGLAFARSVAARPDINLYAADKRHPSVAGSYLAAATTFYTLFGKSPVGSSYTGGLDAAVAAHLQKVAEDTVKDFFRP